MGPRESQIAARKPGITRGSGLARGSSAMVAGGISAVLLGCIENHRRDGLRVEKGHHHEVLDTEATQNCNLTQFQYLFYSSLIYF